MPKIKAPEGTMIITPVAGGPSYTFMGGQIADIEDPMEFARVANLPGVEIVNKEVQKPAPPPIPRGGPRPRGRR